MTNLLGPKTQSAHAAHILSSFLPVNMQKMKAEVKHAKFFAPYCENILEHKYRTKFTKKVPVADAE